VDINESGVAITAVFPLTIITEGGGAKAKIDSKMIRHRMYSKIMLELDRN
jgi:hypothetical protein